MTGLASVDLARLRIDEESFIGQMIALGMEFQKLPAHTAEGLQAYLRIQAMSYGTRNRSGIAGGREAIEHGVYQAIVCLDLGLLETSDGDLNAAVDLIQAGEFEEFRKQGWEIAHYRLGRMQTDCTQLAQRTVASFLQDFTKDSRIWAGVEPGTWMSEDDEGKPLRIDPIADWRRFLGMAARVHLFRALPEDAFKPFRSAAGGRGSSEEVLRNIVVALACQSPSLALTRETLDTFREGMQGGRVTPETRKIILSQIDRLIEASEPDDDVTSLIPGLVTESIDELESAGPLSDKLFVMASGQKGKKRRGGKR